MNGRVDEATLRAAFRQARRQRAQLRNAQPVPSDTVHMFLRPGAQPVLDVVMLRFPDSPYEGPPGRSRYRTLRELGDWLGVVVRSPPPVPADIHDPTVPRTLVALRFAHAVPGSGAELVIEGSRDEQGAFSWRILRAPADGAPVEVGRTFDEGVFEHAFEQPLTLAGAWHGLLAAAKSGSFAKLEVEPGYVLHAAPRGNAALVEHLASLESGDRNWQIVRLGPASRDGLSALEPGIGQWAPEAADAIRSGEIEAGAAVDLARAREHLLAMIEHRGFDWIESAVTGDLFATSEGVQWPLAPSLLASSSVHLGRMLRETAASFTAVVATNLETVQRFVAAVRAARPAIKLEVNGMRAIPRVEGGRAGEAMDLLVLPFRAAPGTPEFDREVRYACDPLPERSDPTRVCRCGAPARPVLRLVPVERARPNEATGPWILSRWPSESPQFVVLAGVACAAHLRFPGGDEFEKVGVARETFELRALEALAQESFEAIVSQQLDANRRVALLAHGPNASTIALHPRWVSGLAAACGRSVAWKRAVAVAIPPDGLLVHEADFDAKTADGIVRELASVDATPAVLRWTLDVDPLPAGRFEIRRVGPVAAPGAFLLTAPVTVERIKTTGRSE